MKVAVKFLGEPQITIDGQVLYVRQKKLLGLLLYLLFHKVCSRDSLISVFWGNYAQHDARRNLRNAVYNLRGIVGDQLFTAQGNAYLQVAPVVKLDRDVDVFIMENHEDALLTLEGSVFLHNFHIGQCEEFEAWQSNMQRVYATMFRERLEVCLKNSINSGLRHKTECFAKKLFGVDPYNEYACGSLMELYLERGLPQKAILLYKEFEQLLRNDLALQPGRPLRLSYQKAVELGGAGDFGRRDGDFYRLPYTESLLIVEQYQQYLLGQPFRHCVLSGEMGVGKTGSITAFCHASNVNDVLEVSFNNTTRDIPYGAAEAVAAALCKKIGLSPIYLPEPMNHKLYYIKIFGHIRDEAAKKNCKSILVIKDIEMADEESLPILILGLLKDQKEIFVIAEYCISKSPNASIIDHIGAVDDVDVFQMQALDRQQTLAFISAALHEKNDVDRHVDEIYKNTYGNLMLLHDISESKKNSEDFFTAMRDETKRRFTELLAALPPVQLKLMERLSLFENGVGLSILRQLLQMQECDVVESLDRLFERRLLTEYETNGRLLIASRMPPLRRLIYDRMPKYKKAALHETAACAYEQTYPADSQDFFVLRELSCHFSQTERRYKKIHYALLFLEYLLDYHDEFFPMLKSGDVQTADLTVDRAEVYQRFDAFEGEFSKICEAVSEEQLFELRMRLNFLRGRTLNRDGQRERGIVYIRELAGLSKALGRDDYLLKAYLEMVFYALKSDDVDMMKEYVAKARAIPSMEKYEVENGIVYRLEGLIHLKRREYDLSESCLRRSIDIFESPKLRGRNVINIAAAYDYLGYLYRVMEDYEKSETFLLRAIGLCLEKNIKKSLDLFYEDLGYTYFLKGEYEKSKECLQKSLAFYDEFGTYWLRSVAESCLSMIYAKRGNRARALEHYHRAGIFAQKESVAEEMELLAFAREELQNLSWL